MDGIICLGFLYDDSMYKYYKMNQLPRLVIFTKRSLTVKREETSYHLTIMLHQVAAVLSSQAFLSMGFMKSWPSAAVLVLSDLIAQTRAGSP